MGLVADRFARAGGLWNAIGAPNGNLKDLGFAVVGVFVAACVTMFVGAAVRAASLAAPEPGHAL